ncbi:MAG: winged helix DNA-binding domain-containing protein [Acidimicrobiia bacterium]|nr:winged helix DNA-binding domain-containing protein [Acidimicrobiia bacterium]
MPEPISDEELNRATLRRQGLIEPLPAGTTVDEVVDAVGPLQAQYNPSPFLAVRARTVDVTPEVMHQALDEYRLVKASLYRQTLHVVSGDQYQEHAAASDAIKRRNWDAYLGRLVDPDELRTALARFTATERSHAELLDFIDTWVAGHLRPGAALPDSGSWFMVRAWSWLIRSPATTRIDLHGRDGYLAAASVFAHLGAVDADTAWVARVRGYLAAFGPASLGDIQSFMGESRVTRARAAVAALRDELIEFTDPGGDTVYDLTAAPRPDPQVSVPLRLLPRFDSLLLAYAPKRRERIIPAAHYDAVMQTRNAQVLASVLVDGRVAGTWAVNTSRHGVEVVVTPLQRLGRAGRAEVTAEAERVAAFLAGDRPWRVALG